jgi:hypothetical protein
MYTEIEKYTSSLCGPSYIYFVFSAFIFVLSVINSITTGKIHLISLIIRFITIYIVTSILNWLCKQGYTNFSWFLLCWMFLFMLVILIGLFITINNALKNADFINLVKAEINKKKIL